MEQPVVLSWKEVHRVRAIPTILEDLLLEQGAGVIMLPSGEPIRPNIDLALAVDCVK